MESITKRMGDVIKTKAVVLDSNKVKVFTKSLSHKKHLYIRKLEACGFPFSIHVAHCSDTISEIYWK